MSTLWGTSIVGAVGLLAGAGSFPINLMQKFRYGHLMFVSSVVSLVLLPWFFALFLCPHALEAYRTLDLTLLLKANLFSIVWGVANLLCAGCYLRVGFVLTSGILTGLSISIGTIVPMVIKGSGLFKSAPGLGSPAGRTVLIGVVITLVGVVCVSFAGFGRERKENRSAQSSGGYLVGWLMAICAGVCAAGLSFSFVYS